MSQVRNHIIPPRMINSNSENSFGKLEELPQFGEPQQSFSNSHTQQRFFLKYQQFNVRLLIAVTVIFLLLQSFITYNITVSSQLA